MLKVCLVVAAVCALGNTYTHQECRQFMDEREKCMMKFMENYYNETTRTYLDIMTGCMREHGCEENQVEWLGEWLAWPENITKHSPFIPPYYYSFFFSTEMNECMADKNALRMPKAEECMKKKLDKSIDLTKLFFEERHGFLRMMNSPAIIKRACLDEKEMFENVFQCMHENTTHNVDLMTEFEKKFGYEKMREEMCVMNKKCMDKFPTECIEKRKAYREMRCECRMEKELETSYEEDVKECAKKTHWEIPEWFWKKTTEMDCKTEYYLMDVELCKPEKPLEGIHYFTWDKYYQLWKHNDTEIAL